MKSIEQQLTNYIIEHKESHYRLAYSYVKNVDDALDIVQDSIYKAISSINTLKEPKYIKTWYYRIIVNTALDFLRKQKKLIVLSDEELTTYDSGSFDSYTDIDLQKALYELPDKYRTIIILRYFEDLKLEEIAEVLGENINTVKTRLYKALQILRIEMND